MRRYRHKKKGQGIKGKKGKLRCSRAPRAPVLSGNSRSKRGTVTESNRWHPRKQGKERPLEVGVEKQGEPIATKR